jgi:hypothetical protein
MRSAALGLVFGCALISSACTTLQPTEASPQEVQQLLLSGELLEPGDRVRLVTADEAVHTFRVTEVDRERGIVVGKDNEVPIANIVAVETRETSVGRTALLVGGVGYGIGILVVLILGPALLLGAG